ncbi:MAG: asparagine synthetase B family protein [Pseudanabaenaceae cyanobacterium]
MSVAIAPQGWVGAWGADVTSLLAHHPQVAWQNFSGLRLAWDVGRGPVPTGGDAWAETTANTLVLGRHPFGRLTLYWCRQGGAIWFATRWRWLLPLLTNPTIDPLAVYGYACFSYVPTPLTPDPDIRAIEAGWEYRWQDGALVGQTPSPLLAQWHEAETLVTDEAVAVASLQTLLTDAVAKQTSDLSRHTVGVLLSGGIDSSTVAALLVQQGLKVRAYTLDFGAYGPSELPYAERVAQHLQIPLTKVDCSPQRVKRALGQTAQALDLPFGDGVCVPFWLLYQTAQAECDVLFNGEGGDQLFAGWTNKPLIAASLYQAKSVDFTEQYLATFHRLFGYGERVFQPEFWQHLRHWYPGDSLQSALAGRGSLLARLRRATLMLKGAQNIHPRAANLALALGLKLRSPFCDEALTRWTFSVHPTLFLQGACEKYILKRAVEPWLPAEIVCRPKQGMGVPLTFWCLGPFWRDLGRGLNPHRLAQEGIWQRNLPARVAFGGLDSSWRRRRIGEILWLLWAWQGWRATLAPPSSSFSWQHPFWLPYDFWRCTGWHSFWRNLDASETMA